MAVNMLVPENQQIANAFLSIEAELCNRLMNIQITDPIAYVYNPLIYANEPHADYIWKYCGEKTVLFLGMNPGPNGMAQNGVPFGDTHYVKDWLQIRGRVNQPQHMHPAKPIQGLQCTRREESGKRFWGFMAKTCGTPEQFFKNCFVHNYCPLLFLGQTGNNISLTELTASQRRGLEIVCDDALLKCIQLIRPQIIVGVGKYAHDRATAVSQNVVLQNSWNESLASIRVEMILHPAPRTGMAGEVWEKIVDSQLRECGVMQYLQ